MKNKMSLLQEGIIQFHQNDNKLWFHGSEFTNTVTEKILSMVSDKANMMDFEDLLDDLVWEYYWGGIIDGFRMCRGVLKELDDFKNPDFLKDLLTDKDRANEEG